MPTITRVMPPLAVCLGLAGCGHPMPVSGFAGTAPAFDPIAYWTGHKHSWGVIEGRDGAPSGIVETDCTGVPDGPDALSMHQILKEGDGTTTRRDWRLRRTGPGRYEATANDMEGVASGEAAGRAFHWRWIWRRSPANLSMNQWMYGMEGGTMVNRTVISALGVTVAEVTEQFAPVR